MVTDARGEVAHSARSGEFALLNSGVAVSAFQLYEEFRVCAANRTEVATEFALARDSDPAPYTSSFREASVNAGAGVSFVVFKGLRRRWRKQKTKAATNPKNTTDPADAPTIMIVCDFDWLVCVS